MLTDNQRERFVKQIAEICNCRVEKKPRLGEYKAYKKPYLREIQLSFHEICGNQPYADIYDPKNDRWYILNYCGVSGMYYLQENHDNGEIQDWKVSKTLTPCLRELKRLLHG